MTAKEYYRQTSDMAFALSNFTDDFGNPDKIVANIVPSIAKNHQEAINILEENDFFSIPWEKFNEVEDTDNLKFEIVFHYGVDDFDRFDRYSLRSGHRKIVQGIQIYDRTIPQYD